MKGKKVLVVGLGKTGVAAARRLHQLGAEITVTDTRNEKQLASQIERLPSGLNLVVGGHKGVLSAAFDLAITSPGVWWESEILKSCRQKKIEVISEIELAYRLSSGSWIAVTGTNGKTTTASMIGAILKEAGIPCVVCGNIGNPAIGEDAIFEKEMKIVAEVSSFQLEGVSTFKPSIAALLNIAPDHLDRHGSMEEYISLKSRIFANQSAKDLAVLNFGDPLTKKMKENINPPCFGFSSDEKLDEGAFAQKGTITLASPEGSFRICDVKSLQVIGSPGIENALAACAVAFNAGAGAGAISKALSSFGGLPHRMEIVAAKGGVRYINDSKGTNVSAAMKALEGMESRTIMILGGRDKDGDFAPLAGLIKKKNVHAVVIGEAADKIIKELSGYAEVSTASTMEKAVELSADVAKFGDTVLLSPACASFDMFENYEKRGDSFKKAVKKLKSNSEAMNA